MRVDGLVSTMGGVQREGIGVVDPRPTQVLRGGRRRQRLIIPIAARRAPLLTLKSIPEPTRSSGAAADTEAESKAKGTTAATSSTSTAPATMETKTTTATTFSAANTSTVKRALPVRIFLKYKYYLLRLWTETSYDRRVALSTSEALVLREAGRLVNKLEKGGANERWDEGERRTLLESLRTFLKRNGGDESDKAVPRKEEKEKQATVDFLNIKLKMNPAKPRRSILFGVLMGIVVAGWVFSGDYLFTGFFGSLVILGQLEYYRGVIQTGVYPARKISVVGSLAMFATALFTPRLHQICLPFFATWAMIFLLTQKQRPSR